MTKTDEFAFFDGIALAERVRRKEVKPVELVEATIEIPVQVNGKLRTVIRVPFGTAKAELERAARTSVALDRLVKTHQLGSLAYYYMGTGNPANEDAMTGLAMVYRWSTAA